MNPKLVKDNPIQKFTDPVTGELMKVDFNPNREKKTIIFGHAYADKTLKGVCQQEFPFKDSPKIGDSE